jgi:cardiolipin synthase
LWREFLEAWPQIVAVLHVLLAIVGSSHAVLTKDDPRSAVGWVGLIWLSPFIGVALYYVLGINRIRRKAIAIMGEDHDPNPDLESRAVLIRNEVYSPAALHIAAIGDRLRGFSLTEGNHVDILTNGDEAYPAMIDAINQASASIMFSTYIFDYDEAGIRFLHALAAAVKRGVEVRVLVDATGSRYSFPSIVPALKNVGVRVARFMPNFALSKMSAINLRTHRKILVVDGRTGFTGGLNIRAGNYIEKPVVRNLIKDIHFRVTGPVVAHLRRAFVEDWVFTTREVLDGPVWKPELVKTGDMLARGVLDGPDKDFEKILDTLYGSITGARRSIKIVTPYFLPDPPTIKFLSVAAKSGVDIEIVLPEQNNIPLVSWASMSMLRPLIESGCKIYFSEPPFDHSKIMVVDEVWSFLGSSNWDARSLRLNFEFNVECYSSDLARKLLAIFEQKKTRSRPVTLEAIRSRKLHLRLRDGLVKLLAPYL